MSKAKPEETPPPPSKEGDPAVTAGDPSGAPIQEDPFDPSSADATAELQAEVAKWKDAALRSAAELDNYRKRMAREAQETRAYANADLLRSLLPILDTFEMGLEAARSESEKSIIYQGLSMVRGQFQNLLREQGVEEIQALCQPFNPNLHEAVGHEAHADAPENTVIRVLRRGYKLKDRLLRPASTVVSSGPAQAKHEPADAVAAAGK
jgi:molecular chaperone GrpE